MSGHGKDYNQPFEAVFARVSFRLIAYDHDLAVFRSIDQRRTPSTLPTWVPDWRSKGPTTGLSGDYEHRYAATGSARPVISLSAEAKILSISGLRLDSIVASRNAMSEDIDDWVRSGCNEFHQGKNCYPPTNEPLAEAVVRVRCLELTDFEPERPITRWKSDSHERVEHIVTHASDGQDEHMRLGVLLHILIKKASLKKFVFMDHGHMGMAPENSRQGDIVTLLLGGDTPLTLRPLSEDGAYTVVGECYVHGFMDGEGLLEARQRVQPERDRGNDILATTTTRSAVTVSGGDVPNPLMLHRDILRELSRA